MKPSSLFACTLLALCLIFVGCSRRQQDWEAARAANTPEAYETFLQKYPEGEFSAQAQASARELAETRDWQNAVAANTAAAYQEFLRLHPDGRMSDDARIRIENSSMAAAAPPAPEPGEQAPRAAAAAPASQSAMAPAPTEPRPRPAASAVLPQTAPPLASTAATRGHEYRVQLGAFSGGEKQAMGEWRRLLREHPQLLDGLQPSVKLATTNTGHVYRLQAGYTDEAGARSICAKLKADGEPCVVVIP